jgi:hypothetical protein
VGIFFDVVLLNGVGATLSAAGSSTPYDRRLVVLAFVALVAAAWGAKAAAAKVKRKARG